MYGYVRPVKDELKVRQYEAYKAAYCGLCHCLRRDFGVPARFVVNYDFTFLAMLLWTDQGADYDQEKCMASPLKRKNVLRTAPALEVAAALSVILAYWKLRDNLRDEGPGKAAASGLALGALELSYRRAREKQPDFADAAQACLEQLRQLEAENCPSLDRPADCFARILAAAAPAAEGEEARRALEQLLYHMGRTVYLLDAADDLEEDLARGGYNPVAARFALEKAPMPEAVRDELRLTLGHSLNALSGAYALLPRNAFSAITENIVYLGLPAAAERVLVKQTPEAVEAPGNTDNDTIGDKI